MKIILTAKHWQLFLVVFMLPFIFESVALPLLLKDYAVDLLIVMPVRMFILFGGLFMWLLSIASQLNDMLPEGLRLRPRRFKLLLITAFIYTLFVIGFMGLGCGFGFGTNIEMGQAPSGGMLGGVIGLVLPLLFLAYCVIYCFRFVSVVILSMELQRRVKFFDYLGVFFLLLFFPIGIWILQPRINKVVENIPSKTE